MADPLSIAASVVGLITAAAQITQILSTVISQAKNAPKSCTQIVREVNDISSVLSQLQRFINGTSRASSSRTSLILLEQIVATLGSCVITFSELDVFVESLSSDARMGVLERLRWVSKADDVKDTLARLQNHKSSLTLMLTILTCQKQSDAEGKVDRLCDLVQSLLEERSVLSERLKGYEATATVAPPTEQTAITLHEYNAEGEHVQTTDALRNSRGFAFEELLQNSRAYRTAAANNSDAFSVISSAGRTASWSVLSGLSLSEVSNLAILAIPIYATDISNSEAYDFEPATTDELTVSPSAEPPSKSPRQSMDKLKDIFRRKSSETPKPSAEAPNYVDRIDFRVLGVPLEQSIRYSNVAISLSDTDGNSYIYGYIPIIVAKVGVYIKDEVTSAPYIFKHAGNATRMMQVTKVFDSPEYQYGKGFQWTGYTVHDAAGLLLRYLKTLPEPVIPYDHYDAFTSIIRARWSTFTSIWATGGVAGLGMDVEEHGECVLLFQQNIAALRPLSRQLLLYLLDLLAVLASKSDLNQMPALRLVECLQPGLLSKPPTYMDTLEHDVASMTMVFLIVNQDNFLIGMAGTT